jgi:hypothetical protein
MAGGIRDPLRKDSADMDRESIGDGEERSHFLPDGPPPPATEEPVSAQRYVILMCVLFLFIVEFSMYIMEPPLQAIMEDFVCHGVYPDHVANAPQAEPDSRCKNPNVQTTLAMARSWLMWVGMFVRKFCTPSRFWVEGADITYSSARADSVWHGCRQVRPPACSVLWTARRCARHDVEYYRLYVRTKVQSET